MSELDPNYDPFDFGGSTEGTTKEEAHKGGGGVVSKPGFYHAMIQSVEFKVEEGKSPHVLVIMEALCGEHESEIGKKIYHRIFVKPLEDPEKERKRIAGLATWFFEWGVMGEDDAFNNPTFRITRQHFDNLVGCQAIVKVSHRKAEKYKDKRTGEEKEGRESYEIAWNNDVWNLNHETVKDVPKDWGMAQQAAPVGAGSGIADDI